MESFVNLLPGLKNIYSLQNLLWSTLETAQKSKTATLKNSLNFGFEVPNDQIAFRILIATTYTFAGTCFFIDLFCTFAVDLKSFKLSFVERCNQLNRVTAWCIE
jgi:hypothetical protein